MFKKLDLTMDEIIKLGVPGNDILVYKDGEEVFRSYRGYSDIENKISMNGKERYNMYSCSKPITATAGMQLIEQGKLSLDEPLYTFIPEYKEMYIKTEDGLTKAKNTITIKDLFCMTAGLDYETYSKSIQEAIKNTDGRCPTVEALKYISQEPLEFEPRTKWRYSLCHDVLAGVIEVVSGMRFGEYIEKNIFKPLGMNNSTFLLPENELNSICSQYRKADDGTLENVGKNIMYYKLGTEYESGGAGLISTVEDYMKFLEALRIGDIILSKESIEKMTTDQMDGIDVSGYWPKDNGYSYGLGVRCAPKNGESDKTDFGWGGAAGAYLGIDIKNGLSVFYGMHVLDAGDLDGMKNGLLAIAKEDLGIK